ncbi:hypothetical protein Tco_1051616 [Tanacetum coccineum]
MWFFESKREWGGRGVKEKNKDSNNVAAKDVVVPPVVDKPVVMVFGNSSGTQDGNVVSSTATPVEGNVTDSSSDPNKRKVEQLRDDIIETVRLKLITFHFKKSAKLACVLEAWKIPYYLLEVTIINFKRNIN